MEIGKIAVVYAYTQHTMFISPYRIGTVNLVTFLWLARLHTHGSIDITISHLRKLTYLWMETNDLSLIYVTLNHSSAEIF